MSVKKIDIGKALEQVHKDIADIWQLDGLVSAIETEDEIGCVLRMHIYFERFLNCILELKVTGELKKVIGEQRDFKPKLALCAALGMPVQFGLVLHQVNIMRNKLAHGRVYSIDSGDLLQLSRLVDVLLTDGGKDTNNCLSNYKLKLGGKASPRLYEFGKNGERIDFILACGGFLQKFSSWMMSELLIARGVPREFIPKL